ncbi:MAG: prepilin-type N-terminal cleavage/methylation domain-containing protein [Candidatus Omnitrophica bacterium]|nr:prepilin-type N-terminal cleavage/methylation domain-containing protein [Candidatus Omnitrophota bacterium]
MYTRKADKKRLERGFTLIEITIAAGILAFALCAIFAAYISFIVLSATSRNINIATNGALGVMEEIRSTPFSQIMGTYNGFNFILNDIPQSRGVVYVDNTDPDLLQVTISVCWRQQDNRVIGEDLNLNGVLDPGEDTNGNGIIDSPVELVTRIANR